MTFAVAIPLILVNDCLIYRIWKTVTREHDQQKNDMKFKITDYLHRPGEHCGSTALRNLLRYYCNLDMSEALVFGLGSGIEFLYIRSPETNPEILTFGRSATLEQDLSDSLGLGYQEENVLDDDRAWEILKAEILKGKPAVIASDTFYLDHRKYKYHFPFNRFVVVGFDDDIQKVYIHTRVDQAPQAVSYKALKASRNPPEYPIFNLWGQFRSASVERSLEEGCRRALKKAALRMTGQDNPHKEKLSASYDGRQAIGDMGLEALEAFRKEFPAWRNREKASWILSYASQTIERFGTGGGNFRRLYAGFLTEARVLLPDIVAEELPVLATKSADAWTELSQNMYRIAKENHEQSWDTSVNLIGDIIDFESQIFHSLLEKLRD